MTQVFRGEGRFVRQGGGPGMYGHCLIELQVLDRGAGFAFVDRTTGGVIPKHYLPDIERGVQEAMARGVLAGFPIVDVQVSVVGGFWHPVDSHPWAFQMAGRLAFEDACRQAPMTILEPIARLEVLTPPDHLGTVLGDVHRRRGHLEGQGTLADGTSVLTARIPVAEMFGYATDLRSLTQGRGSFSLQPCGYDEVPEPIQARLIARAA